MIKLYSKINCGLCPGAACLLFDPPGFSCVCFFFFFFFFFLLRIFFKLFGAQGSPSSGSLLNL